MAANGTDATRTDDTAAEESALTSQFDDLSAAVEKLQQSTEAMSEAQKSLIDSFAQMEGAAEKLAAGPDGSPSATDTSSYADAVADD